MRQAAGLLDQKPGQHQSESRHAEPGRRCHPQPWKPVSQIRGKNKYQFIQNANKNYPEEYTRYASHTADTQHSDEPQGMDKRKLLGMTDQSQMGPQRTGDAGVET